MASYYGDLIRETLARIGRLGVDPRHVEAYMRVEYSTLDAMSPAKFRREVEIAVDCISAEGLDIAERLAKSYGL